jgi:hypothetical protein
VARFERKIIMGTRALIKIKDEGKTIVAIYRQMDGYPSGLGAEIKKLLNDGDTRVINGYQSDKLSPKYFNGMGCLAAYLIGGLKIFGYGEISRNPIGSVYIVPPNSLNEEYTYTISTKDDGEVYLKIEGDEKYNGKLRDFKPEETK